MALKQIYNLKEGVQVRNEVFGLLFYNYRGPRLYFVPTKDLIDSQFFDGKQTVKDLIESIYSHQNYPLKWIEDKVCQVLQLLEGKELIYGQSVC